MIDTDANTEQRLYSLGVNNRILPPTRFAHQYPLQDDRIARLGGPFVNRKLQFPKFLKVLEEEEERMAKGEYKVRMSVLSGSCHITTRLKNQIVVWTYANWDAIDTTAQIQTHQPPT